MIDEDAMRKALTDVEIPNSAAWLFLKSYLSHQAAPEDMVERIESVLSQFYGDTFYHVNSARAVLAALNIDEMRQTIADLKENNAEFRAENATLQAGRDLKHEEAYRIIHEAAALFKPPEGWQPVPIEATDEMINAAQSRFCEMRSATNFSDREIAELFKAMVAAAPTQEEG